VKQGRFAIIEAMSESLAGRLKKRAMELGFSMAGVVEAKPGRRLAAYRSWLANEYHGEMGYMARPDRVSRREDPGIILPGVRSLVCIALDYATGGPPASVLEAPSRGRISNYAWGLDYHDVMTPRLVELAAWLAGESGSEVQCKVYVDTGAILERDHAETAGLGFTGKNTMLIGPRRGSWFFLGELLTTALLPPDSPGKPMPGCGSCRRCLDACPTGAFPEPYVLDARRCISYLTIELKGWIPVEYRPLMGNWVYGCDVCQEVCPFNRFAPESREDRFRAVDRDAAAPPLIDLLSLDDATFASRFAMSPIGRIGRGRLVRNACVSAGNWGSAEAVPHLSKLLHDPVAIVRGHAAWALGRIGGAPALRNLGRALQVESDPVVRRELVEAMQKTP
jgi:epoxyqueuosine reductase